MQFLEIALKKNYLIKKAAETFCGLFLPYIFLCAIIVVVFENLFSKTIVT